MAMESLHGRPLGAEELQSIRTELERISSIAVVDFELRGIVARNWPHLLSKLPPDGR
jgi:hypothetical protein